MAEGLADVLARAKTVRSSVEIFGSRELLGRDDLSRAAAGPRLRRCRRSRGDRDRLVAGALPPNNQPCCYRCCLGTFDATTDEWKRMPKNTICLWFDGDAEAAATFYAQTFPDSRVLAVHRAPSDYPSGKAGDVLMVDFTVAGIPCIGLNGGPNFPQTEAFSFQIATDDQAETDRYWDAIVGNGGQESACGWCMDRWGVSWQITPRVVTEAMAAGGETARRAFEAMMPMQKIDVATIEEAVRASSSEVGA